MAYAESAVRSGGRTGWPGRRGMLGPLFVLAVTTNPGPFTLFNVVISPSTTSIRPSPVMMPYHRVLADEPSVIARRRNDSQTALGKAWEPT